MQSQVVTDSTTVVLSAPAATGKLADGPRGGVRWMGGPEGQAMPAAVFGSAHGPRLLELLRTAC